MDALHGAFRPLHLVTPRRDIISISLSEILLAAILTVLLLAAIPGFGITLAN